jgi:uncharacterized protein (TIGR02246 family)
MKPVAFTLTAIAALAIAAPAVAKPAAHHSGAKSHSAKCAAVTTAQASGWFDSFNQAWATKNPATVTALFAKDAVLLATVSNTPRTTPAAVEDYFVTFLKKSPVGTIDTSTIKIGCNSVTRVGTWTVKLTDAASGKVTDVKARYSFIYKPENGTWKIDHLHSSMMPEPAA